MEPTLEEMQAASRLRHMGKDREVPAIICHKPRMHRKQAAILRSAAKRGRTPLKDVDFSKVSIAAGKVAAQPRGQESSTEPFQRPPAVYGNIPSPYGIATDLLWEQLKKSG